MSSASSENRWVALAVALLLAVHYALAVGSKAHESTTSDELAHLVSGTTFWELNDYRMQPENGNLPQRWEAIPAAIMGTKVPTLEGNERWKVSDVWSFGHEMMYETGDDHFPRLMAARAMIALFSVAVGLVVFLWCRSLFGLTGAFLSLTVYAFYPSLLAHGALATSDICVVFFLLVTLAAWWRALNGGGTRIVWLSALLFGLSFVAKYSALLLIPIMGLLLLARALHRDPLRLLGRSWEGPLGKLWAGCLALLLHVAAAFLIIWASFGFRYAGANPHLPAQAQYIDSFPLIALVTGWQGRAMGLMARFHILPEAYLYGYTYVLYTTKARGAFLDGLNSTTGWTSFFPKAFFYKSTLPSLGLYLLGVAGLSVRWSGKGSLWKKDLYRAAPLVLLFVIYWAGAITSHLNIGERHLLPTYPEAIILTGAAGVFFTRRRVLVAVLVAGLGLWHVAEAALIYPHYLAYFNEAVGGPEEGHTHLVDSSLDWGQDLPSLADWLKAHTTPSEPVYLSYFGTGEPDYYHIRAKKTDFLNGFHLATNTPYLSGGLYCVSATILEQPYGPVRGPWTLNDESKFQDLKALLPVISAAPGSSPRPDLEKLASPQVRQRMLDTFCDLRMARLCYYLRLRKPLASVGYTIFVYRLSDQEVHDLTDGTLKEWSAALLRASDSR